MTKPEFIPVAPQAKRQRDLRLDFFRGLAMFIILLAHTPGNTWTLWIPARFGFSDATEIFVFCSGMASAMAFGAVYLKKSWFLGTARIAFRCWQVYWAHIGVIFATVILLIALDKTGMGEEGKTYANWPSIVRIFSHTQEYLFGIFTLNFVPGLFDILPMYLVILAMIPVIMGIHKIGGRFAVFAFMLTLYTAAQFGGYLRLEAKIDDPTAWQVALFAFSENFDFLNLPGSPWNENVNWFFNPFGWQLVFFTGFAFGVGWLPAPPVRRWLVLVAVGYILATMPFAWHKLHGAAGFLAGTDLQTWIIETRSFIQPMWTKITVGPLRYLHFLALAYVFWVAVGDGGVRLNEGWKAVVRSVGQRRLLALISAPVLVLTAPHTYTAEIAAFMPSLNAWILEHYWLIEGERIGLSQLAHLLALITFIWNVIGDQARQWLIRDAFVSIVPIIRKVGTQSLAVFMVSIVLSRFNGWWLDVLDRDVWSRFLVNGTGFAVLIATAYLVGWFKRQPWREDKKRNPQAVGGTPLSGTPVGQKSGQAETLRA
ncbi:MAG: OpgC domain-containing protein [Pseudomonadota bacterium]